MQNELSQLTGDIIDAGTRLLERDITDAYSFLGIQAERLEIAEIRLDRGRPVPPWTDEDALAKVLSDQRASLADLRHYASKGKALAMKVLNKVETELKQALCHGGKTRLELKELESDVKTLLNHVSTLMVGVLIANLPAGLVGATASIAATLSVIVIKTGIKAFCQSGVQAVR